MAGFRMLGSMKVELNNEEVIIRSKVKKTRDLLYKFPILSMGKPASLIRTIKTHQNV